MRYRILIWFLFRVFLIAYIFYVRVNALLVHVQTFYFLESMVTKIHIETLSIEHKSGETFNPGEADIFE